MSDMRRSCNLTGVRSPSCCWTARVVGVDFDPGYLLERLRSGEEATELLKQGAGTRPGTKARADKRAVTWKSL